MQIQYVFELLGTVFFAVSGTLAGTEKSEHDWFGVTFIAFITSIGGGSLRDVLLGSYPLFWVGDTNFIFAILLGIVLSGIFFPFFARLRKTFFLFDTLGIALFTIVGTEKALHFGDGVSPVIAAIMGMFTAVMGGVTRDVLTNETPIIFHREIYATACLVGAILYLVLNYFGIERNTNFLLSGAIIVFLRIIAVKYNLSLPKFGR